MHLTCFEWFSIFRIIFHYYFKLFAISVECLNGLNYFDKGTRYFITLRLAWLERFKRDEKTQAAEKPVGNAICSTHSAPDPVCRMTPNNANSYATRYHKTDGWCKTFSAPVTAKPSLTRRFVKRTSECFNLTFPVRISLHPSFSLFLIRMDKKTYNF